MRLKGRDEIRKNLARKPAAAGAFAEVLGGAEERGTASDLGDSLTTVNESDRKLRDHPNFDNLEEYKKAVRGFLEIMVNRYLKVTRRTGRIGSKTKIYTMIEKVDDTLDEIERGLRDSVDFDLAAKLDEIRGILIDLYS